MATIEVGVASAATGTTLGVQTIQVNGHLDPTPSTESVIVEDTLMRGKIGEIEPDPLEEKI